MRFDIEGFVHFDTENSSLVNLVTGDSIELSVTSTRLLTALLQHRKDIISREEIFQVVFEQYGARSSNSNLNQYISTIRRNLSELGIEKHVIITVPRIGFKISNEIIVTSDSNYSTSYTLENVLPSDKNSGLFFKRHAYVLLSLIFLVLLVILYSILYQNQTSMVKVMKDKCTIYAPASVSVPDLLESMSKNNSWPKGLDCSIPKELYLFKKQLNGTLGSQVDIFLMECDKSHGRCSSYYYKGRKNA